MFKELLPLIKNRPVTLTVVALPGDVLRVCVIPQAIESDKKVNDKISYQHKEVAKVPESAIQALTTPLALEGTAEEIDAKLAQQLTEFANAHVGLQNSLNRAAEQISQAVREIEERNKANKSKSAKPGNQSSSSTTAQKNDASAKNNPGSTEEKPDAGTLPLEWCSSAPASTPPQTATEPAVNTADEQR